jgi:hypothetical protein
VDVALDPIHCRAESNHGEQELHCCRHDRAFARPDARYGTPHDGGAATIAAVILRKQLGRDPIEHWQPDADGNVHGASLAALWTLDDARTVDCVDDFGIVGALHGPTPRLHRE